MNVVQRVNKFVERRFRSIKPGGGAFPKAVLTGISLTAAGVLAACSAGESDNPAPSTGLSTSVNTVAPSSTAAAASAVPGIEVSVPPAPDEVVPRVVAFDPCFRVADSLISRVGFDPSSRERNISEVTMPTWTKIGCTFHRSEMINGEQVLTGFLSIATNTEKLAEVSGNERNEVVGTDPINGRPAITYRSPLAMPTCDAAIESPDGTLLVSLTVPPAAAAVPAPCDQIREVATVVAGALDGN